MEDSRDLLIVATSRIFSNLARLQPSLDFEAVTVAANITDSTWAATAAYAFFFQDFLGKLEGVARDFNKRVVEDSRDLLIVATSRIFTNLARLHPSLDFEDVTASVHVTSRAYDAAATYAKKFDQIEVDEGAGDDAEDAGEEEDAADGAGASGGAQA